MILKFQNKKYIELDEILVAIFGKQDFVRAKTVLNLLQRDTSWDMQNKNWRAVIENVGLNPDTQKHIFYRIIRKAKDAGMIKKSQNTYSLSVDYSLRMQEFSEIWRAFVYRK